MVYITTAAAAWLSIAKVPNSHGLPATMTGFKLVCSRTIGHIC